MKKQIAVTAALGLIFASIAAHSDVFSLGAGLSNLETVRVGDAGNTGELSGNNPNLTNAAARVCGAVSYAYNIGKYEVTAAQYTDFLNHKAKTDTYGLYDLNMADTTFSRMGCNIQRSIVDGKYSYSVASDWANRPVNYVSYWDSLRFANWINNGQGDGDTETGAYTLDGYNGGDGRNISRNAGANWFLTSEDEWYKAAYYKGGGTDSGYWDYPTRSDIAPGHQIINPDPGNQADYGISIPYWRTVVGEFENSASVYGTYDQGGNVWELNESIIYETSNQVFRGTRGGSFQDYSDYMNASTRYNNIYVNATQSRGTVGFRLANMSEGWQPVPEPSSVVALAAGLVSLIGIKRRKS